MILDQLLNNDQSKLSDLDKELLKYIIENKSSVTQFSISELSEKSYVSKSTIIRLMKKLGFSGYSEFKFLLNQETKQKKAMKKAGFDLFKSQTADIQNTLKNIDNDGIQQATDLLAISQIIYCYGTGYSQRKAAEEFSKQLIACGKKVILIPNQTELEMMMSIMTSQDCLVIVSLSGETPGIKNTLLELNIRSIKIISVTRSGANFISQHATHHFFYYLTEFPVRENIETLSFVTLHLLLDYIVRFYVTHYNELE
ncbi:hypothetical protein CBF34_06670 [Vagococcus penaei]|uniref:MurR/RpiR family transcriptional regulator n=1 Tax=Vagococcus penaei TaxID=633807 RepID=UPI000F877AD2|nr:MurR/RpiR family transcriptional regulator [Vagococcus penaei]RSU01733.1 hypothetical protein CBF34_06670 [Vagococcus penaei]